jgi:hypothetical protein
VAVDVADDRVAEGRGAAVGGNPVRLEGGGHLVGGCPQCIRFITRDERADVNAVPVLRRLMGNSDLRVRWIAASSVLGMGERGAPAVPELLVLLDDPHPQVRCTAALALGFIGPGVPQAPILPAPYGDGGPGPDPVRRSGDRGAGRRPGRASGVLGRSCGRYRWALFDRPQARGFH